MERSSAPRSARRRSSKREVERDAAATLRRIVDVVEFPAARAGYLLGIADTLDPPLVEIGDHDRSGDER
jgi:hypothetical protein